jgi:predicted RNA-binding protein with TRAM domain
MMRALDINGGGTSLPISTTYSQLTYSAAGTLTVRTGKFAIYNDTGSTWTFIKARADVGTAPTGAGIVCIVKVNGSTSFTITIPAGATTSGLVVPVPDDVVDGAKVTVDITQIGSSVAGADLSITLTTQSIT